MILNNRSPPQSVFHLVFLTNSAFFFTTAPNLPNRRRRTVEEQYAYIYNVIYRCRGRCSSCAVLFEFGAQSEARDRPDRRSRQEARAISGLPGVVAARLSRVAGRLPRRRGVGS